MQSSQSLIEHKQRVIQLHADQAKKFAEAYSKSARDPYQGCFEYSRKRLDVWLDRYLPGRGDGLKLLDIGCGTGHYLSRFRQRGFEVAGVDNCKEMLKYSRAQNPASTILYADAEKIPFPDNTFDFLLCVEVLRYLPNPSVYLREMARVLKPQGVCLATALPALNLNGYWFIHRLISFAGIGNFARSRQFFTTSLRLRRQFANAGFSEQSIHGVSIGPVNWFERLTPSVLPKVLRAWEPVDVILSDLSFLKEFSNMFFIHAVRHD